MARSLAVLLSTVLVLAGCTDPGGVGASLLDVNEGVTRVVPLPASSLTAVPQPDITGDAGRILVGSVDDPDLGTTAAHGYMDFLSASLSDAFKNGTVTKATLVLKGGYVYGYTDRESTIRIHDMPEEWVSTGANSDTTIAVGDQVMDVAFTPGTTSIEIDLPAAWLTRWDTVLRGSDFSASFHGFGFMPLDASAIAGFEMSGSETSRSRLMVVAGGDTVTFFPLTSLTHLDMEAAPATADGAILLQDGRKEALRMVFDLDESDVALAGLSRGLVSVQADTTFATDVPEGFVRPMLRALNLYAVYEESGARILRAVAGLTDGVFSFESAELSVNLSDMLARHPAPDYFEIAPPQLENGLGVLLLNPDRPPKAVLTVVEAQ